MTGPYRRHENDAATALDAGLIFPDEPNYCAEAALPEVTDDDPPTVVAWLRDTPMPEQDVIAAHRMEHFVGYFGITS